MPREDQQPFNLSISEALQTPMEKSTMQQTRGMIFFTGILLVVVVCLFFPDLASAADANVIANIVQQYKAQSAQIISVTTKYAQQLFALCVTLEIAWLGVNAALGRADMGEIVKKFCITLVVCGFFLAVINNYYEWSQEVVNGLYEHVAGEAVGVHDSSDLAFKKGLQLCNDMLTLIKKIDWKEIGLILTWSFTLIIVLVVFCMIAARVIIYKCEAFIAMAASCILLGFGGSSVMRDFAMNTLRYILAVGMKLFTMQLIIVTGYSFVTNLVMQEPDVALALTILGCVIVLFALLNTLPGTVAGLVSGSSGGSGTIGGMGRTALGAAAAAAAGSYAGARNVGLAMQTARAEGATGIGGTLAGTARTLWQASRESAQDRESRQNTVGSSLRTMLEAARAKNLK